MHVLGSNQKKYILLVDVVDFLPQETESMQPIKREMKIAMFLFIVPQILIFKRKIKKINNQLFLLQRIFHLHNYNTCFVVLLNTKVLHKEEKIECQCSDT